LTTSLESIATSRLVDPFAARLEVLAFDAAAADHAADIRAELERRGQTIGGDDLLPALSRGAPVIPDQPQWPGTQ
jgi:tRNA(fMet)-specific endonuclease VapC